MPGVVDLKLQVPADHVESQFHLHLVSQDQSGVAGVGGVSAVVAVPADAVCNGE